MALQAAYKQFLAVPTSAALTADASLHYITTTTSFIGATDIIKHLGTAQHQVKKKQENILYAIEGPNAVALEAETTLEFVVSGGPYLPGLDDNFVADRTVILPIIHIVTFDEEGKIQQVRQSWDQGSLLKQLEVIGKSGRNWPIRDSKEQIKLITKCVKSGGEITAPSANDSINRARGNSNNILRDPHASLSLFAPREEVETIPEPVVSPYAGRRPRQRDFTEILGDEPVEDPTSPSHSRARSPAKAGASKHFQPIRLFEADENADSTPDTPGPGHSPERVVRPNPKKYQHFDFADGSDPNDAPKPGVDPSQKPKTKRDSNWSFEDFVTPQKPTATRTLHKGRDVRHWGAGTDVVEETPDKMAAQVKGRRDAEAHFELVDDGPEPAEPRPTGRPRGSAHNTGLHLYENNLYKEDGSAPTPGPAPLGNITNNKGRQNTFNSHFDITNESPRNGNGTNADDKVGDDHKKAVRMMESNWSTFDESPVSRKENSNPNATKNGGNGRGIVIAGDGMGSSKTAQHVYADETHRKITIAGDGMGGRKGAGRAWGFGDDSDEESQKPKAIPPKKPAATAKSDFWDF